MHVGLDHNSNDLFTIQLDFYIFLVYNYKRLESDLFLAQHLDYLG